MKNQTFTAEEKKMLKKLTAEMRVLLDKVKGKTKAEIRAMGVGSFDVLGEMENYFGVPALQPEVPAEAKRMFFALIEARYGDAKETRLIIEM